MLLRILLLMLLSSTGALAGEADVLEVDVRPDGSGYRFDVLVQHADTGWEHYADRFEVLTPAGEILGTRTLLHPHVDEQPFRRSLTGVIVPDGIDEVIVRAHDNVDGYGGREVRVPIER